MNELIWLLLGAVLALSVSWAGHAFKESTDAVGWGENLRDWDGSDEEIVFTPDPRFYDQEMEARKIAPNVTVRRRW